VISIIVPIYTYAIYPLILKFFKMKYYTTDVEYQPFVTVIIFNQNVDNIKTKLDNLMKSKYPANKIEILEASNITDINKYYKNINSEIIVFSDVHTEYDHNAISSLVKRFADNRIGCVCGQMRRHPDENGIPTESSFWRYENRVKIMESNIGCLSGANNAIYAVRKEILPTIQESIINVDFFISTYVLQKGYDVVIEPKAIAFEEQNDIRKNQFFKHVHDGSGYYQSLGLFWRLLFPRKGSFVYISHRVCRWFVPLNMIILFMSNAILAFHYILFTVLFACQVGFYLLIVMFYILKEKIHSSRKGLISQGLSFVFYFVELNIALALGFFKFLSYNHKKNSN